MRVMASCLHWYEADMPVVPPNIYRSVEPTYHENEFVDSVGGRHPR